MKEGKHEEIMKGYEEKTKEKKKLKRNEED